MFGLGERVRDFQLEEGVWPMWANGNNFSSIDDGRGRTSGYGSHPFLLVQTNQSVKAGDYIGIFFRNSNAQAPIITYNGTDGSTTLSYITIGGQLELYFFIHGSAKEVIASYHQLIGTPNLPPFWSLGW